VFHHYKELKECVYEVMRIAVSRGSSNSNSNSKKKEWLMEKEEEEEQEEKTIPNYYIIFLRVVFCII
jgi:hypothetical protein